MTLSNYVITYPIGMNGYLLYLILVSMDIIKIDKQLNILSGLPVNFGVVSTETISSIIYLLYHIGMEKVIAGCLIITCKICFRKTNFYQQIISVKK